MQKSPSVATGGATVLDVRRTNESSVLRRLYFGAPLTRQDLMKQTGISAGTVTNLVTRLIDKGLVVESGTEESAGGRPRVLLDLARDSGVIVGVEIGETRILVELFDFALHKISGVEYAGDDREPGRVVRLVTSSIVSQLHEQRLDGRRLLGVGVGSPGIVDEVESPLVHAKAFGWRDVPLAEMLAKELSAPILVENSAKAMGQAEMWFGAGRGATNGIVALLGTGVGAGVFVGDRLYRGAHSSAGEWGHTTITVGGRPCRCGSIGCLEAYVGGFAIAERWPRYSTAANARREELAVRDLVSSAGDSAAGQLLAELTEELACGLGSLVNLFNPDRIVLQGWVGLALGPTILPALRDRIGAHALEQPFEQVAVVLGELGSDAGPMGAATFIVDAILKREELAAS